MENTKVLFVSQNITPYLDGENIIGHISRYLPQGIHERGREIRTFMPQFGNINVRRNQLHEVIRLSGMNLIINNTDHPLILKVASIQSARMQIYFIDNEEYFHRKYEFRDKNNKFFDDNDERAIFFARGVIETVKKLGWSPDIIHCHGWMSCLTPIFIKKSYKDNPLFSNSKVVVSIYDDFFDENFHPNFANKIKLGSMALKDLKHLKEPNYVNLMKNALDYSDGLICGSEVVKEEVKEYAEQIGVPVLPYHSLETYIDAYNEFYDKLLKKK